MNHVKLNRIFFIQDAKTVAKKLLGKYLVHYDNRVKLSGKIIETEAYVGIKDKASHGYGGNVTERNKAEFLIGGHIYIYLVYGMYWQLNITTGKQSIPECVLIRALEPIDGFNGMMKNRKTKEISNLTNGPGKLCQAMNFNKKHYGLDITKSYKIYIEDRNEKVPSNMIVSAKRIGIDYAGRRWKDELLRFYIKGNKFVSKIN